MVNFLLNCLLIEIWDILCLRTFSNNKDEKPTKYNKNFSLVKILVLLFTSLEVN